jgi:hypothetical protein
MATNTTGRLTAALLAVALAAAPWAGALAQATRTGKERMVEKARDPQRVDDCKVPIEKRDPARPRADCAQPAATASAGEPETR